MFDEVLAVGSHEPKSFVTYLTIGLVLSALFVGGVALVAMVPSTAGERLDAERAHLYTHSAAFWARWPYGRLLEASYDELASEATRCDRIVEILQRQRGSNTRPARGRARQSYDEISGQIANFQSMVTSVRNAMNYVATQDRGPRQPPRSV